MRAYSFRFGVRLEDLQGNCAECCDSFVTAKRSTSREGERSGVKGATGVSHLYGGLSQC